MNSNIVVVLVAGLAILASLFFRRRGYSHNQRIVLSGIAVVLLFWTYRGQSDGNPAFWVFMGAVIAILVFGALYLRKSR